METIYNFIRRYPVSLIFLLVLCGISLYPTSITGVKGVLQKYDKLAHFVMYASFCTVVWYEYLRCHVLVNFAAVFKGAVAAPVLIGGLLEYVQGSFTATRSGDYMDFLFNLFGVLFAAMLGIFVIMPLLHKAPGNSKAGQ